MRKVSVKFVSKVLAEQKQLRVEITQDMLDCENHDPDFIKTITTDDKTWVYGYQVPVLPMEAPVITKTPKITTGS